VGESIEDVGRATALGRTARAHEIAEVIVFVSSPKASYLTGETIRVDAGGGLTTREALPRPQARALIDPT
jgi:NAD(P)-dependent dehydrogenase (short-subunit alcohol dehydrogenase family)